MDKTLFVMHTPIPIILAVSGVVAWRSISLRFHLATARGISQAVHRAVTVRQLARVLLSTLVEYGYGSCAPGVRARKGDAMRYQVTTPLTPREALEQALADFGPGGLGLQLTSQTNLSLVFQGGGGHIAVTAEPGAQTTLELETREWDYGVQQFMARVQRRRPWWQRWWRRKKPSTSRPASFTVLNKS
jgi:hypothetical protein